jgi:hypothetical protein
MAYGFSTELTDAEVLAYYDKQLKANGWTFQKDEAIKYMGSETHVRRAVYIKGEYNVDIGYGFKENEKERFDSQ